MLLATVLPRVFILKDKGQDITLTDPETRWSVEAVMNFLCQYVPNFDNCKGISTED